MILEIIAMNVFEVMSLQNNLLLICRFKAITFYSLYKIHEIYVYSAKIWLVKT